MGILARERATMTVRPPASGIAACLQRRLRLSAEPRRVLPSRRDAGLPMFSRQFFQEAQTVSSRCRSHIRSRASACAAHIHAYSDWIRIRIYILCRVQPGLWAAALPAPSGSGFALFAESSKASGRVQPAPPDQRLTSDPHRASRAASDAGRGGVHACGMPTTQS